MYRMLDEKYGVLGIIIIIIIGETPDCDINTLRRLVSRTTCHICGSMAVG